MISGVAEVEQTVAEIEGLRNDVVVIQHRRGEGWVGHSVIQSISHTVNQSVCHLADRHLANICLATGGESPGGRVAALKMADGF